MASKRFCRKLIPLIAIITISLQGFPVQAANLSAQSKRVLSVFQSSKSSIQDQLNELEQKFERDMDRIDEDFRAKEIQLEKDAIQAAAQLDLTLLPQIAASQTNIDKALAALDSAGEVEVLVELRAPIGRGAHEGADYLACPKLTEPLPLNTVVYVKSPCANQKTGGDYPKPGGFIFGENWKPGDKTKIFIAYDDKNYRGHLTAIDGMLAAGEIRPINPVEFNAQTAILKTEPLTLEGLKAKYERDKKGILAIRSSKIADNAELRENEIDELESEFNSRNEELQALQDIDELGIKAAKRASKSSADFDKAFSIAFRFEYNKQQLELIANDEWDGDLSYRSINTLAKVLALLDLADSIAAKYSFSSASKFNSSLGTVFTRNAEFRGVQKYVSLKYQKATGKRTAISV